MQKTSIAYADYVTNPLLAFSVETGRKGWSCVKYSSQCKNCWAETVNKRFGTHLNYSPIDNAKVDHYLDEHELDKFRSFKFTHHKNHDFYSYVFACDMTDWMLPEYDQWRDRLLWEMSTRIDVRWLLLTKRWDRLPILFNSDYQTNPSPNIFIGLTISDSDDLILALTNLFHVFLSGWPVWISNEPAIAPVTWPDWADFISMLVSGGESGPRFRKDDPDWYRSDRDWCIKHRVPFFFKQWAGLNPTTAELDGVIWHQMPNKAELSNTPIFDQDNHSRIPVTPRDID